MSAISIWLRITSLCYLIVKHVLTIFQLDATLKILLLTIHQYLYTHSSRLVTFNMTNLEF